MLRTLGALGLVLGMLAGALWTVRRYDLRLPGRVAGGGRKRVELVERLAVDAKRSVALIRRDGCEHLILIGPEGHATIETGIVAPVQPVAEPVAPAEAPARIEADLATLKAGVTKLAGKLDFRAMVDRIRPETDMSDAAPIADAAPAPLAKQPGWMLVPANDADPAPTDPEPSGPEPSDSARSDAGSADAEAFDAALSESGHLDTEPASLAASRPRRAKSAAASTRTRGPRDTTRWNKRAVREALNA